MKKYQIVKVKNGNIKGLVRNGGPMSYPGIPIYQLVSLESTDEIVGHVTSLDDLVKPTIQDIIEYVDNVNKDSHDILIPDHNVSDPNFIRRIAIIMHKSYLTKIKDYISQRVYDISNKFIPMDQWDDQVALLIHKRKDNVKPEASIIDAKDLRDDIITIDLQDIDITEFDQADGTIRFLFTGTSVPYFANKDFKVIYLRTSGGLFDKRTCEVEFGSPAPILKELQSYLSTICGNILFNDINYTVSDPKYISQELETMPTKETVYNIKITFNKCDIAFTYTYSANVSAIDKYFQKDNQNSFDIIEEYHKQLCEHLKEELSDKKALIYKPKPNDDHIQYSAYWDTAAIPTVPNKPVIFIDNTDEKEKESDIMKINDKDLKQIIIDEDRKTVTTITEENSAIREALDLKPIKKVTVAKASEDDEFDQYVGVALTLAYQLFGSKEKFHKFVRESGLVKNVQKNKKAREAAKEARKKEAAEAHKKAVARRAKEAKDFETRQAKLDTTVDTLLDELTKRMQTKHVLECVIDGQKKTKKGE